MDETVAAVLEVLGDGGTTDMAHRVIAWLGGSPNGLGIKPESIVDRAEIAGILGLSRQAAAKTIKDPTFPAAFRTLAGGTDLYDREQVGRWRDGNPDLVGASKETT